MKKMVWFFLLIPVAAFAGPAMDDVKVEMTHVAGSVYMITGRGGNIGVSIGEEGVMLIDDQYAPLTAPVLAAIAKQTDKKVDFVLNTHWHGDHTGGNENLGKAGTTILAHDNVRVRMASEQNLFGKTIAASPSGALPMITFDRTVTVHFNGETIHAVHFPRGHTDGDSVVFFPKANVIHMGDLSFFGMFPFVDQNAGGNVFQYLKNVAEVIARAKPGARIIPGHGKLTDLEGLKAWHTELSAAVAAVRKARAQGLDLEAMKQKDILQPWAHMGKGFINGEKFLGFVYQDLVAEG